MFSIAPDRVRASDWADVPDSFGPAWERLAEDYPGVRGRFNWSRVGTIYGRPLCGGDTVEQAAENFLSRYIGLFGLTRAELVRTRVLDPPIGGGPAYVSYHQTHNGIRVQGAGLTFTISGKPGHLIKLVTNRCHPSPGPTLREERKTREEATRIARGLFDPPGQVVRTATRVIWPMGRRPVPAWIVDVHPAGAPERPERIIVSAYDGAVAHRQALVDRFGDFTVTVKGKESTKQNIPPDCDTSTTLVNLENVLVNLEETNCDPCDTDSGYTDDTGQVVFTNVPNTFTVVASLESPYFKLYDGDDTSKTPYCEPFVGSGCTPEAGTPGGSTTFTFENHTGRPKTTQHMNVWHWLHQARDWVEDRYASYPGIGTNPRVLVACNDLVFGPCNARYTHHDQEPLLQFGNGNGNCAAGGCKCDDPCVIMKDLHYSTIVAHEYGHRLHHTGNPDNQSLSWKEGIADSLSSYVVGTSKMGKKLCDCSGFGTFGRDIAEDYHWPEFSDKLTGRSMAGAHWDLRTSLNDNDRAGKILLHSILKEPLGVDPNVALHAVLVDDDSDVFPSPADDDISNGSPNYETINAAFRLHDLATDNVPYVTIDWENGAPGDPKPGDDVTVQVNVNPGALVLPNNPMALRYRINTGSGSGGSWSQATMTYDQPSDSYSATISGSNTQAGDVIDFYVRCETTSSTKKYTCFPAQAQFDFTLGMEERDFFSLVVTESTKTTALSTNLDTDPGWTLTQGEWEHGTPSFTDVGEQPAFDFPFDAVGITPQDKCYYTGLNGPVTGTWDLTTTTFDLTGADVGVVSYALWFYARGATDGTHKLELAIYDGTVWTTFDTINVSAHVAKVRWIRQRLDIPDTVTLRSGMKLRFRAIGGSGSNLFVEACIDEVRVWGVFEP